MDKPQLPLAKHASLSLRMLAVALVAGGLFSLLDSAFRLGFQYRHDMNILGHQVMDLVESHHSSLSMSLYRLDENQLHAELKDLVGHLGLMRLRITEADSKNPLIITEGKIGSDRLLQFHDTLWIQENGSQRALGLLAMDVDAGWPLQELRRGALLTLLFHVMSLLFLSLIVIALAHFGVTRHLLAITRQLEGVEFDGLERRIVLKRLLRHRKPDEIDQLRDTLNSLLRRLEEGRREKELQEAKRLDAEKRHQANRKLEALGNLAGGIAHDINNILGIIMMQTEMVLDKIGGDPHAAGKLNTVIQAVESATDIVRQILVFSRNSDGKRRNVDVSKTLQHSLVLLQATMPSNVKLRADIASDCGFISAEPADMQQVIFNLGLNAFHAMEAQGGTFTLALKLIQVEAGELTEAPEAKPGLYAVITLSDTGMGMEKAVSDRIFEPYFTTKEIGKGTGLGLAVVHGIVAKLDGHIFLRTEVGRGTTFRVLLPVLNDIEEGGGVLQAPLRGHGERILFAEDEPLLRLAMQEMLESLGYQVTPCCNGRVALEALQSHPEAFDALLTDLGMPIMGGADLADIAVTLRPNLPVAVYTGFANPGEMDRLQMRGIQIVTGKPFLRHELAQAMHDLFLPHPAVFT